MSLSNIDLAPLPLDAFDEHHAAEIQARSACERLIEDDGSSLVSDKARPAAALPLIIGTLANHMAHAELATMLEHLAKQIGRDGIVVQRGRVVSLN